MPPNCCVSVVLGQLVSWRKFASPPLFISKKISYQMVFTVEHKSNPMFIPAPIFFLEGQGSCSALMRYMIAESSETLWVVLAKML